jgi:hypothetical protein
LVDQINFGVADEEGGEGQQVFFGLPQHGLDLRELPAEHAGDDASWACTCSASGWANTVRMAAATTKR